MNNEEKILEMLSSMQTNIAGMQSQITGMQTQITGIQGEIKDIRSELGEVREWVDGIDRKVEVLTAAQAETDKKVDALAVAQAETDKKVDELNRKVTVCPKHRRRRARTSTPSWIGPTESVPYPNSISPEFNHTYPSPPPQRPSGAGAVFAAIWLKRKLRPYLACAAWIHSPAACLLIHGALSRIGCTAGAAFA